MDFFGEIAGLSFTPDTDALFIGISDMTYSSLLELERTQSVDPAADPSV
jgi:secreted PhoX family phosphatase